MTLKDKLRNIAISGATLTSLLVGSAHLSSCKEKPVPAQNQVQVQKTEERQEEKERQYKAFGIPNVVNDMEARIDDNEPFKLENQVEYTPGQKICKGRQNRLIGSRIVEIKYNYKSTDYFPETILTVKEEGSLFGPERIYSLSVQQHIGKGKYVLRDKDGKEINLEVIKDPFPREREGSLGETLWDIINGLSNMPLF